MDANFLVRAENERLEAELIELAGHLNAGEHRFLVLLAEFDRRQGWGDGATHSLVHWQQASRGVEFYHDDDGSLVVKARLPAEVGALVLKAFEVAREVQCQEHVPAETCRRLACDCSLIRITEDAEGEPLSVGRKTRSIPPAIRRALNSRDKGCRFPGCTHSRYVDGHHVHHWADGGETSLGNLVLLCHAHHRWVHEGGGRIDVLDDGALRFVTPDGRILADESAEMLSIQTDWTRLPALNVTADSRSTKGPPRATGPASRWIMAGRCRRCCSGITKLCDTFLGAANYACRKRSD